MSGGALGKKSGETKIAEPVPVRPKDGVVETKIPEALDTSLDTSTDSALNTSFDVGTKLGPEGTIWRMADMAEDSEEHIESQEYQKAVKVTKALEACGLAPTAAGFDEAVIPTTPTRKPSAEVTDTFALAGFRSPAAIYHMQMLIEVEKAKAKAAAAAAAAVSGCER